MMTSHTGTAWLHPAYAFTRQAEEGARQRLCAVVGPDKEDAAMRCVVDLYAANTELTLDEAVSAIVGLAGEGTWRP